MDHLLSPRSWFEVFKEMPAISQGSVATPLRCGEICNRPNLVL